MHSFRDRNSKLWVACTECTRGENGSHKKKCPKGFKIKRFNGDGCLKGKLMEKYKK